MPLTAALIILAMLTQGAIAFVLLLVLGFVRLPMVKRGAIAIDDIALSRDPWPPYEKRISNAFDNQFQLPVLFYVACGLSLYLGPGWIDVVLAWLFVVSRIVHASIFATRNVVVWRFASYAFGFAVLAIFWLMLVFLTFLHMGTA